MAGDTILVMGSGATVGGGFRVRINNKDFVPPLDRDFFKTHAVQFIFNPDDYPALSYYRQDPGLEATWAKIDMYFKLCRNGIISEEQAYDELAQKMNKKAKADRAYRLKMEQEDRRWVVPSMAGWEILHLIREVYKNVIPPQGTSPLRTLITSLREKGNLKVIISFNYDTSLEKVGIPYYYPLLSDEPLPVDVLTLIKLHGSLNWQTDTRADPRISIVQESKEIAEMDHGVGWYRQPEVIGPTFFKQEITLDFKIEGDFRAPYYKPLWAIAWNSIKTARHGVFIGFSFPQTDFHAAALFRTAHLMGAGFRRVILCHKGDFNILSTAHKIFEGKRTQFTEFDNGLETLAQRRKELLALLE